jgi:hypothetical protein
MRYPIAKTPEIGNRLRDHPRRAFVLPALDNSLPFCFTQLLELGQQSDTQGRVRMNEKMRFNVPSGCENTRAKRLDAVITDQLQELKSIVKAHLFPIMAGFCGRVFQRRARIGCGLVKWHGTPAFGY